MISDEDIAMSNTSEQPRICEICAEDFKGRGEKREITCIGCEKGVCMECCKTYILDETQPKCMYPDCGLVWSRQFLVTNFPNSFITNALRKKREDVFFEQEKALLPATQETVNRIIRSEKINVIYKKYKKLRDVIEKEYTDEYDYISTNLTLENKGYVIKWPPGYQRDNYAFTPFILGVGVEPLHVYGEEKGRTLASLFADEAISKRVKLSMRYAFIQNNKQRNYSSKYLNLINTDAPLPDLLVLAALSISLYGSIFVPYTTGWRKYHSRHFIAIKHTRITSLSRVLLEHMSELDASGLRSRREETPQSERRFVRGCPKDDCKGYLSTGWKCGLCNDHVCSNCHVPTKIGEEHICDPDVAATAQLIASESKPCPGCRVNIYKIDGCNQMWCTQCKTPWDWKSGRIETKVHNPHYLEYLRTRGTEGAQPDRNPNEVRCGREIDDTFARAFGFILKRHDFSLDEVKRVHAIARGLVHFDTYFINGELGDSPNAEFLRICYMRGLLDEKTFKKRVQMTYKKFHKEKELQEVFVMFKQTVTDILYRYRDALDTAETRDEALSHISILDEVGHLEQYVNVCLKNIAVAYQSTPMEVTLTVKELPSKFLAYGLYNPKMKSNSNGARALVV